jgi:hypothetical protein
MPEFEVEICKDCEEDPCECEEASLFNPDLINFDVSINSGVRLNTELLGEFGMTLSELERKYGTVSRSQFDSIGYAEENIYTYYFRSGLGGYGFTTTENNTENALFADGSSRVSEVDERGQRIVFTSFKGSRAANRLLNTDSARADDLFLGMTGSISVEELKRIPGVEIPIFEGDGEPAFYSMYYPPVCPEWGYADGHSGFWYTSFWQGEEFTVSVLHEKEGVIELDSQLFISYYPQGAGRY